MSNLLTVKSGDLLTSDTWNKVINSINTLQLKIPEKKNNLTGIGTATPTHTLDIVSPKHAGLLISSTGNYESTIRLFTSRKDLTKNFWSGTTGSGNKGWMLQAISENDPNQSNHKGNLRIYYHNDKEWKQAICFQKGTMNIGIGTNTPTAKLEVKGPVKATYLSSTENHKGGVVRGREDKHNISFAWEKEGEKLLFNIYVDDIKVKSIGAWGKI